MGFFTPNFKKLAIEKKWDSLVALLDNRKPQIRLQAFMTLYESLPDDSGNKYRDSLLELLDDPNTGVRLQAVKMLLRTNPQQIMNKLYYVIENGNLDEKLSAFRLLSSLKDNIDEVPSNIITLGLNDKNSLVQIEAIRTIGIFKLEKLQYQIEPMLQHDKPHVRLTAVSTLGRLANKQAVDMLVGTLMDASARVRKESHCVLENIGTEQAKKILHDSHFNMLVKMMNGTVADKLKMLTIVVAKHSEEALPLVRKLCSFPNKNVRIEAVKALGMIKSNKSLPALIPLLKDKYFDVRLECLKTFEKMNDTSVLDLINEARSDTITAVQKEAKRIYFSMKQNIDKKNNE